MCIDRILAFVVCRLAILLQADLQHSDTFTLCVYTTMGQSMQDARQDHEHSIYGWVQVVPGNPLDDVKLLVQTVGSILRGTALRNSAAKTVNFSARPLPSSEKAKPAAAPAASA